MKNDCLLIPHRYRDFDWKLLSTAADYHLQRAGVTS